MPPAALLRAAVGKVERSAACPAPPAVAPGCSHLRCGAPPGLLPTCAAMAPPRPRAGWQGRQPRLRPATPARRAWRHLPPGPCRDLPLSLHPAPGPAASPAGGPGRWAALLWAAFRCRGAGRCPAGHAAWPSAAPACRGPPRRHPPGRPLPRPAGAADPAFRGAAAPGGHAGAACAATAACRPPPRPPGAPAWPGWQPSPC